jgi:hypothetical protein
MCLKVRPMAEERLKIHRVCSTLRRRTKKLLSHE